MATKKSKKSKFSFFGRRRGSKKDLTAAEETAPAAGGGGGAPTQQVVDALPSQYRQDIHTKAWHPGPGGPPSQVHVGDSPGGNVSAVTHGTGMPPAPSYLPQSYAFSTPERKGSAKGRTRSNNVGQPDALLPAISAEETTVGDGSQLLPPPAPAIGARVPETKRSGGSARGSARKSTSSGKAGRGSFWSRSNQFRKLADWAFEVVDADKSGQVDKKELYSGLLLIHLNLASYMGPAACRPATREYVETIFDKMDVDGSGTLDRDEFADVMSVLCGQVMTRVVLQWSMTLMIVPLLAQYVLDGVLWANRAALEFWAGVDAVHLAWDHIIEIVSEAAEKHLPDIVWTAWDEACRYWAMIPESVLEVLPLTLISCVLGGIAVPYMLFKIDDFFHGMADKKREGKKKNA